MNFLELYEQNKDQWKRSTAPGKLCGSDSYEEREEIASFFERHDFKNFEFIGQGSSAVVLQNKENPDIVFRIGPLYAGDTRAIIPQVLQPLHVFYPEQARIKVECLKNAEIPEEMGNDLFDSLRDQFRTEVVKSGHSLGFDEAISDMGMLDYERDGKCRQAFLAVDPSYIEPVEGLQPSCSADYPSLEDQWHTQLKIIQNDSRLKRLVGGEPKPLPKTLILK